MRLLLRATATMGSASAAAILFKMVGAKIIASILEPSGVGAYSQLLLITDLGAAIAFLGLGAGIVRYASEFRSSEDWAKLLNLEGTLIFTLLPFSLLMVACVVLLSAELSTVLLGSPDYAPAVSMVALSWPLVVLALVAENLTNASKQIHLRALAIVANAAVGITLLAILVSALGILGAGIALVAAGAFQFALAWCIALRLKPRQPIALRIQPTNYDMALFVKLFQYGVTSLFSVVIMYASVLAVRASIIMQLGPEANGLYQVVWASQSSWQSVLLSAFSSYFYPLFCEATDTQSRREQFNRIVRFMILLTTPFLGVYVLFRSEAVLLLYTPLFLPAASLLGISLLYGLFNVLASCINLPLMAMGRLRAIAALALLRQSVFVVGSYLLLPMFHLQGVVFAAGAGFVLSTLVGLAYTRQKLDIRLSFLNARTLIISVVLVSAIFALSELHRGTSFAASPLLFLLWAYLVLDRSEVAAVRELIRQKVKLLPPGR